MGVLPVINATDFASVKDTVEKIKTFLPEGSFVHCDIADAAFTFHKTWNSPSDWANLRVPYELEVHLMVEHPEAQIEPWIAAGARRFIVHFESATEETLVKIFESCDKRGIGVALSSNPETTVDKLATYLKHFPMFQVLTVHPGLAGQSFLPLMVDKIVWLRREYPHAIIEVDGGMNAQTARIVKNAGADLIVASSYLFGGGVGENSAGGDPKIAYGILTQI
jgi:ribulose-phosphate 3-epimerase